MNFLAHLYLSEESPGFLVGSLLGDFAKGLRLEECGEDVRRGIRRHWEVDAFTDAHPVFRESRLRISPLRSRYSGVLIDIFYDHFLARRWARYARVPLREFSDRVYGVLAEYEGGPERFRRAARAMAEQDWLGSYAEVEGIRLALARISRRARPGNPLADAAGELEAHYAALEADFERFFPELIRHTVPRAAGPARTELR